MYFITASLVRQEENLVKSNVSSSSDFFDQKKSSLKAHMRTTSIYFDWSETRRKDFAAGEIWDFVTVGNYSTTARTALETYNKEYNQGVQWNVDDFSLV